MKIDIHAHTKKTKSGDSPNRTVSAEQFSETIRSTDVGIIAITNHNHFDLAQYKGILQLSADICQVWPGIELDVAEATQRGHLLAIVNPKFAQDFSARVKTLCAKTTADDFVASLDTVVSALNGLDAVFVAHYYAKKPALSDSAIDRLVTLVGKRSRVIKEATDALSAGIYVGHGHLSIFGSDVSDWSKYIEQSRHLPDLRLPVDSYEQFCLLLDKDEPTIDTILNQKKHELISVAPFAEDKPIELTVYNDINVFFGSKGTGKTELLRAISRYYNERGLKTRVYEASNDNVGDRFDVRGSGFSLDLSQIGVEDCRTDFKNLLSAQEPNITSLSTYVAFCSSAVTNARARTIKGTDYRRADEREPIRRFEQAQAVADKIHQFRSVLTEDATLSRIVRSATIERAVEVVDEIAEAVRQEKVRTLVNAKVAHLFNSFIAFLTDAISRKTGKPRRPTGTGFIDYARNRISLERSISKIIANLNKPIEIKPESVGDLGEKGVLFCVTDVLFQTGSISDASFRPVVEIGKGPQKQIAKAIAQLSKSIYSRDLFERLADFSDHVSEYKEVSLKSLLLFSRRFEVNGKPYSPSSGESSMLLLHRELSEDKEVYLLDEPEKSLGNDYISDVIVPLLKEKARNGKKVFVATHDANIAVRTLPYSSIYRRHERDTYTTFVGNPFTNYLVNTLDSSDRLDWKAVSMKTLEGGRGAFGERGRIYGNP